MAYKKKCWDCAYLGGCTEYGAACEKFKRFDYESLDAGIVKLRRIAEALGKSLYTVKSYGRSVRKRERMIEDYYVKTGERIEYKQSRYRRVKG
jgi:hypothetical protein